MPQVLTKMVPSGVTALAVPAAVKLLRTLALASGVACYRTPQVREKVKITKRSP